MNSPLLSHEQFLPHIGAAVRLKTPEGLVFHAVLDQCETSPRSTMPGSARMAFNLVLSIAIEELGDRRGGHFLVSIDGGEDIGPLYLERVLSSRPGMALLEIIFN